MEEFLQSEEVRRCFSDHDHAIPGGESINQLLRRIFDGLGRIRDERAYDRVLVISHGSSISNVYSFLSGASYRVIDYCTLRTAGEGFEAVSCGRYDELPER